MQSVLIDVATVLATLKSPTTVYLKADLDLDYDTLISDDNKNNSELRHIEITED